MTEPDTSTPTGNTIAPEESAKVAKLNELRAAFKALSPLDQNVVLRNSGVNRADRRKYFRQMKKRRKAR